MIVLTHRKSLSVITLDLKKLVGCCKKNPDPTCPFFAWSHSFRPDFATTHIIIDFAPHAVEISVARNGASFIHSFDNFPCNFPHCSSVSTMPNMVIFSFTHYKIILNRTHVCIAASTVARGDKESWLPSPSHYARSQCLHGAVDFPLLSCVYNMLLVVWMGGESSPRSPHWLIHDEDHPHMPHFSNATFLYTCMFSWYEKILRPQLLGRVVLANTSFEDSLIKTAEITDYCSTCPFSVLGWYFLSHYVGVVK